MRPTLRKELFWDVNNESIDFEKHARFIIERVVTRGNLNEWNNLKLFYGLDKIRTEVVNIRYMDKKTLSFLSAVFKIKREMFRCFNTEQSIKVLWDY